MTKRLSQLFLIALFAFLTAAASFNGFYGKWGLNDAGEGLGVQAMLDGKAARPWAYRLLVPAIANKIDAALPRGLHDSLSTKLATTARGLHYVGDIDHAPVGRQTAYAIRYYIVYYAAFGALFLAVLCMIALARSVQISMPAAMASAALVTLFIPVMLTIGGYFYDLTELFFMFSYLLLLQDRRLRYLCVPLALLAALNKESFLFFIATTAPLCLRFEPGRKWPRADLVILGITVVSGLVAGLAHVVTLPWYAQNDGSEVQFWLPENLAFYINPLHLFRQEKTYGVPIPTGYSIMTLLMVVIAVAWGWRRLPPRFRAYAAWAAVINLTLMMLFAFPGEIRNLTFLLPSLVLCLGKTIDAFFPPAGETEASRAPGRA